MPNDNGQAPRSLLFTPIELRGLQLKNRVVISPMCQYSAHDGCADDWHLVHLGRFATGGAGLIFTEATAVEARGRITHGDLGIWKDEHIAPLKRIADFIKTQGAAPAIQLAHAGRKASMQRPWYGNGPLGEEDFARGDRPWETIAPSAQPIGPAWIVPHQIGHADLTRLLDAWREGAQRALAAGFEAVEVHGAHGYLLHTFLSPLSNKRGDEYGGSLQNRMRFPLQVAAAVRAVWPQDKPVFFRTSATDYAEGGWTLDDTVALARELKALGIDVIDCSSGGIAGSATAANVRRLPGYQVPFAQRLKREAGIKTQAVGIILNGAQAEEVLQKGQADLIAVGREALYDPNWALHAARELGVDPRFALWPQQSGWWLDARAKSVQLTR